MIKGLGATGKFPDGKINKHDEGELRLAVHNDGKLVRIDFGKRIAWTAMPPETAEQLGAALIEHAKMCRTN